MERFACISGWMESDGQQLSGCTAFEAYVEGDEMYAYASALDVHVDTPRPNFRNRYQRQRAQLPQVRPPQQHPPQRQVLRVQRASQPALYYHPSRSNVLLEHIPLSDPRHPLWTGDPPPRRHSLAASPSLGPQRRQRSRSEVARERALELAMEVDPTRELRDARWVRRQRTSSVSGLSGYGSESAAQERRRRGRATRWPSSGSVRTVSTRASFGEETAPWRATPSLPMNPNPRPASTPEVTLPTPLRNRRETLTLRHVPHEPASSSSSSRSLSFITTTETLSQRLRRRRSTFSLRSRRTFSSLHRRASRFSLHRTRSQLRDRRSTFSLRVSGRRHTLSTARAAAADGLQRARSMLLGRWAPGRAADSAVDVETVAPGTVAPEDGGDEARQIGLGRRLSRQLSRWNFGNPIPPTLRRGRVREGRERERERQGDGYDTDVQHVENSFEGFDFGGGISF